MIKILTELLGQPVRRGKNLFFHSPFHDDKDASLQVSEELGKWHDWGNGASGDLIDFVKTYYNVGYKEACALLRDKGYTIRRNYINAYKEKKEPATPCGVVKSITHIALLQYAQERGVSADVLRQYCRQYEEDRYYYIALPNVEGGYALRNRYCKTNRGANSFFFFTGTIHELLVFEGMFDFLSFETLRRRRRNSTTTAQQQEGIVILNSTANVGKVIRALSEMHYSTLHLYLDNDDGGRRCATQLMSQFNCIDHSSVYAEFNDVNDYIIHHYSATLLR